jgi:hypothetical protein
LEEEDDEKCKGTHMHLAAHGATSRPSSASFGAPFAVIYSLELINNYYNY